MPRLEELQKIVWWTDEVGEYEYWQLASVISSPLDANITPDLSNLSKYISVVETGSEAHLVYGDSLNTILKYLNLWYCDDNYGDGQAYGAEFFDLDSGLELVQKWNPPTVPSKQLKKYREDA